MSTTGTQASGTMTGLNDILKNVYEPALNNNIVQESELWDLLVEQEGFEVSEGPDGKQINLGHIFAGAGGVGYIGEDDYLPTPSTPVIKQSNITIKQAGGVVELSGRTLRRVKEGPAAFANWADEALPMLAQRIAFHKDRALVGAGNGILFKVTQSSPSGTGDTIGSAYGISGLENAVYTVLEGDNLRWSPNADGSSPRTGAVTVSAVNYAGGAISTGGVIPTSGAQNDFVFLGDANLVPSGTKDPMGLEGIVDDGTNVATFQGLSRTTYPKMQGQVVDSTSLSFGGVLSEDLIDYGDSLAHQRGGGKPDILVASYSGIRSFWKSLKSDRQIMNPAGAYTGGKKTDGLKMILGDRTLTLRPCRKVPDSRAYMLEKASMKLYKIGTGRWDDTDGSIWNRVVNSTGRKDAFFAAYVEEYEIACKTPMHQIKFTGLVQA